ncbi:mitochondrial carrier domain-containing protein [Aspergillus leporis]|uniref:Mitochondrial carrier domain-containing protein n=1 Tax=Aspergillus leporis TaxID=41062 RepID=A0A5N5X4S6_9EURO|nr:mitochondrial carrier domain-containing protein [Aspergillus leporis]
MASELEARVPMVAGWKENTKDLTAGAAGEIAQVLIGQPFDLVKVRLQTQDGGIALPGSLMPLLGIGACVSVQFSSFHGFRQGIESYNQTKDPEHAPTLSLTQFYLSGAGAGNTSVSVYKPDPHGAARIYNGPWDCTRKIIRAAGISGIYRGQAVTLLREIHGYGAWLAAYEGFIALCGGLAGWPLWLLSHPLDMIKSKMQSDGVGSEKKYHNMRYAFRHN